LSLLGLFKRCDLLGLFKRCVLATGLLCNILEGVPLSVFDAHPPGDCRTGVKHPYGTFSVASSWNWSKREAFVGFGEPNMPSDPIKLLLTIASEMEIDVFCGGSAVGAGGGAMAGGALGPRIGVAGADAGAVDLLEGGASRSAGETTSGFSGAKLPIGKAGRGGSPDAKPGKKLFMKLPPAAGGGVDITGGGSAL
jgi:hypothetical protein